MLFKLNVYLLFAISHQLSNLLELSSQTLYLLVSSANNLCKQLGPRSGPTGLIWIQTAWLSTDIPEKNRQKTTTTNKLILKKNQQTTKLWQITSYAKRVDELKWKVLHGRLSLIFACFQYGMV